MNTKRYLNLTGCRLLSDQLFELQQPEERMGISRRQVLKAFAFSSFVTLSSSVAGSIIGTNGKCDCVNILLHGLFFMEFQRDPDSGKDMLVIATPDKVVGHHVVYRDHGGSTPTALSGVIDLRKQLLAGSKNSFSSHILHFSRRDIGMDPDQQRYFIDAKNTAKTYACVLLLPWPKDIVSLRRDLVNIQPWKGNVASSLRRLCDSSVGLVTRLKYFPSGNSPSFITRSCYAEHCHRPSLGEVNCALRIAQKTFVPQFDLEITVAKNGTADFDGENDLPDEINPDDEKALEEANPCLEQDNFESVEVATCPHFGVIP